MRSPEKTPSNQTEDSQKAIKFVIDPSSQEYIDNIENVTPDDNIPNIIDINPKLTHNIEKILPDKLTCSSLSRVITNAKLLRQIELLSSLQDAAIDSLTSDQDYALAEEYYWTYGLDDTFNFAFQPRQEQVEISSNALNILNQVQHEETTSPLIKLISEHYGKNLSKKMKAMSFRAVFNDGDKKEQTRTEQSQKHLKELFHAEKITGAARKISRDAIMIYDHTSPNKHATLVTENGESISMLTPQQNNSLEIDKSSAILTRIMHTVEIEKILNERLGLQLSDISIRSQIQLLRLLTTKDEGRFNGICSALKNTDEKNRLKLAEAFFAADFGADFGDSLIDIANSKKFTPEQVGTILDNIDSCRTSIGNITELYSGFDNGDFARQYSRAANERLTDVLAVFRHIANSKNKNPIHLGWPGTFHPNYENAIKALEYETKSLGIISGTLGDVQNREKGAYAEVIITPNERNARTMYNFYSPNHGYVLAYTRPLATERFDPSFEYGKRDAGVEASMSLIVNPEDPFTLLDPFRPKSYIVDDLNEYDPGRMDKVSAIRIDREGRFSNEPANSPYKSPIRRQGTVSVDLAAINDRSDTPSGKIARLISAGNIIRSKNRKTTTTLNHNTNFFNQEKYGTERGFEQLVNYIDTIFTNWCKKTPPESNEGYTGLLRSAARKRGRKALGKAS